MFSKLTHPIGLLLPIFLIVSACGKKDEGGSTPTPTVPNTQYSSLTPSPLCVVEDVQTGRTTTVEGVVCRGPDYSLPNLCSFRDFYDLDRGTWLDQKRTVISCVNQIFDLNTRHIMPSQIVYQYRFFNGQSACAAMTEKYRVDYQVVRLRRGTVCMSTSFHNLYRRRASRIGSGGGHYQDHYPRAGFYPGGTPGFYTGGAWQGGGSWGGGYYSPCNGTQVSIGGNYGGQGRYGGAYLGGSYQHCFDGD